MRCYLAGAMTGIPNFNYPAFHKAAAELRAQGYEVSSPAEHDIAHFGKDISQGNATGCVKQAAAEHGFCRRKALAADLAWICAEADCIALLPGWQNSSGARAERAVAEALGLQIIEL